MTTTATSYVQHLPHQHHHPVAPFRLKMDMAEAIEAVLLQHSELLLKTDVRAYPSRSFKQGVSWHHLEPMSDLIVGLVNTGKLLQTQVEKAIDKVDTSLKGAIKMMVKRTRLVYEAYRKDLAFVLRIMAAHLLMKRQAWEAAQKLGRIPRSHPEWAMQAYLNITVASSDVAPLQRSASASSQQSFASAAEEPSDSCASSRTITRDMILAGRHTGVAVFPMLSDTLGDDEEDGSEEDDEDQGEDNDCIASKYWDPKLKKAVAVMKSGMIKYSSMIEAGPNGFVLAMWNADLGIPPLELEITNDLRESLEVPVLEPGVCKRPAKAQSDNKKRQPAKAQSDNKKRQPAKAKSNNKKRQHEAHAQQDVPQDDADSNKQIKSDNKKLMYSRVYHKTMNDNKDRPIDDRKALARALAASALAALD